MGGATTGEKVKTPVDHSEGAGSHADACMPRSNRAVKNAQCGQLAAMQNGSMEKEDECVEDERIIEMRAVADRFRKADARMEAACAGRPVKYPASMSLEEVEAMAARCESAPMDIVAVANGTDIVTWSANKNFAAAVSFDGVADMVTKILDAANGRPIRKLCIGDHGSPLGLYFGKDYVSYQNWEKFRPLFRRLGGVAQELILMHCKGGDKSKILADLRDDLGISVSACEGLYNPIYNACFGKNISGKNWVTCRPEQWACEDGQWNPMVRSRLEKAIGRRR
jgi:hypothetical protein